MRLLALLACLFSTAVWAGAGLETYVLQNKSLRYEFTPQIGGRGLAFSVPGLPNLLRVGEAVREAPDPVVSPDGPNYPYLGHIVWIGPQQDWWRDQSVNEERRKSASPWPPDPYTVLIRNELLSHDASGATLRSPPSPVTGLQLDKRLTLAGDGLEQLVTATNRRDRVVSRDIWFNTRVSPAMQVYVPVADATADVRLESLASGPFTMDSAKAALGYFGLERGAPLKGKAFIQPSAGWLAAFGYGQVFVIEFERQPLESIYPEHGQVELYIDADPEHPDAGLLELEIHSAYRTLQPAEAFSHGVRWRAWPSDASGPAAQVAELRERGYVTPD